MRRSKARLAFSGKSVIERRPCRLCRRATLHTMRRHRSGGRVVAEVTDCRERREFPSARIDVRDAEGELATIKPTDE